MHLDIKENKGELIRQVNAHMPTQKNKEKRIITDKLCCKTNFLFKILFLIEISLTNDDPK